MIHTAFCKPKIFQGHCHFHPATEVTGNGATAFPETSEATSKFFVCPFHSSFQLLCGQPTIHEPHSVSLLGQGHHTATHGPSQAGQGPAGGIFPPCLWRLNAISPRFSVHPHKISFFYCFEDQILPRFKKNENKMCNDCKHWFLSTESCMCQETAARVHQLQRTRQQSSFLELLQNSV